MTKQQAELLKKCVFAVRSAQEAKEKGDLHSYRWRDFEMVEVGWINGVNPRTAESLIEAGILVSDQPSWASELTGMFPSLEEINR